MDPTLIIFAALAGFVCYRLYLVLGTRGGHEPDEQEEAPVVAPAEELRAEDSALHRPAAAEPDWVAPIRAVYPAFDAAGFRNGAKAAYEMIVDAFAAGALAEVKPYLDPGVYRAFATAVKGRRDAGQISDLKFVGIHDADVADASVDKGVMRITVDFRSDQVRVLRDSAGAVIEGDPNRIDRVHDRWTFSRAVSSRDPNWILVATGGAAPDAD